MPAGTPNSGELPPAPKPVVETGSQQLTDAQATERAGVGEEAAKAGKATPGPDGKDSIADTGAAIGSIVQEQPDPKSILLTTEPDSPTADFSTEPVGGVGGLAGEENVAVEAVSGSELSTHLPSAAPIEAASDVVAPATKPPESFREDSTYNAALEQASWDHMQQNDSAFVQREGYTGISPQGYLMKGPIETSILASQSTGTANVAIETQVREQFKREHPAEYDRYLAREQAAPGIPLMPDTSADLSPKGEIGVTGGTPPPAEGEATTPDKPLKPASISAEADEEKQQMSPEVKTAMESVKELEDKIRRDRQNDITALEKEIQKHIEKSEENLASLIQDDLDRANEAIEQEVLLQLATGSNREQAVLIAKERGFNSPEEMAAYANARMRVLDEETKWLTKKENGQTPRQRMNIWAKQLDNDSLFPNLKDDDPNLQEKIAEAKKGLGLERARAQLEAMSAAMNVSTPEEQEALARSNNHTVEDFKKWITNQLGGHILKDKDGNDVRVEGVRERARDLGKDSNGKDKPPKLATPTWRGGWKALKAAKEARDGAQAEIEKLNKRKDLPDNIRESLIQKQQKIIDNAKNQRKQMIEFLAKKAGKASLVAYLFLLAAFYIGGPMILTSAAGKLLGVQK